MSIKTRATKSIALALAGITIATPMLTSVYAFENSQGEREIVRIESGSELSNINTNTVKDYMQSLYGDKDEFVKGYSYGNKFSEVNPAKGIIRINELNESNEIISTYDINMYENELLESINNEDSPEERKNIVYKRQYTGSPIDKFSLAVYSHGSYNSDFRISIGDKNGNLKNYYKNSSWETGATASFKKSLISAQSNVSGIKKLVGTGAVFQSIMSACVKFFGKVPILEDIKVILGSLGIAAVTIASTAPLLLNYFINVRNCGSYYNQIIARIDTDNYLMEE